MITKEDVLNLAALSRLHITEEEIGPLTEKLDSILNYVALIGNVSLCHADATSINLMKNVMREDAAPHEPAAHTDTILAVAPATEGDFIKVKKILS